MLLVRELRGRRGRALEKFSSSPTRKRQENELKKEKRDENKKEIGLKTMKYDGKRKPLYSKKAPISPYAEHFPFFLEYTIELEPDAFQLFESNKEDKLTFQWSLEKDIIETLTVLTNHRFFKYQSHNSWGVITPPVELEKLEHEISEKYNNQHSSWFIRACLNFSSM